MQTHVHMSERVSRGVNISVAYFAAVALLSELS